MYKIKAIQKPKKYEEIKLIKDNQELERVIHYEYTPIQITQSILTGIDWRKTPESFENKLYKTIHQKTIYQRNKRVLFDFSGDHDQGVFLNDWSFLKKCDKIHIAVRKRLQSTEQCFNKWTIKHYAEPFSKYIKDYTLNIDSKDIAGFLYIRQRAHQISTKSSCGESLENGHVEIKIVKSKTKNEFIIEIQTNITTPYKITVPILTPGMITAEELSMLLETIEDIIQKSELPIDTTVIKHRLSEYANLIEGVDIYEKDGMMNPHKITENISRMKTNDTTMITEAKESYQNRMAEYEEEKRSVLHCPIGGYSERYLTICYTNDPLFPDSKVPLIKQSKKKEKSYKKKEKQ